MSAGGTAARAPLVAGTFAILVAASCVAACLVALATSVPAHAQNENGGALAGCIARSPVLDDVHDCLDDYLGLMDANLADLDAYIERTLAGEALTAFATSRRSFAAYRRDNCLWYLAFSTPRSEAELIAKDCLAMMSIERLSELQRLLAANDGNGAMLEGFYVYGASRNSFRPCNAETRYWVEGEATVVGELQQTYLETATEDRQVLFATLRGTLEDDVQTEADHDGVLRLTALTSLRVPRDSDCRLPTGVPTSDVDVPALSTLAPVDAAPPTPAPADEAAPVQDEPEQQLIAYFGAWLADCSERSGGRVCTLSTVLADAASGSGADDGSSGGVPGEDVPALTVTRQAANRTDIGLVFPGREIDSPIRLRWSIDGFALGDIVGSSIRVDESGTRQLIDDRSLVDGELLPMLIEGDELSVDVFESVDDETWERFRATLVGLTRALAFADGFVRDGV